MTSRDIASVARLLAYGEALKKLNFENAKDECERTKQEITRREINREMGPEEADCEMFRIQKDLETKARDYEEARDAREAFLNHDWR